MKRIICGMALFASIFQTSLASADQMANIQATNPNASPYQLLQILYNQSPTPAAVTDFDLDTNTSSTQTCVGAESDMSTPVQIFYARAQFVVAAGTPGTPAEGPLFPAKPATPDQMGTIISFSGGATNRRDLQAAADAEGKDTTITTTSTDLVETVIDSNNTESKIIINVRKNGNLLAIHGIINAGASNQSDNYVYCYRQ